MYPGTACNRDIPVRITKPFLFKESEDEVICRILLVPAVNISETDAEYLIAIAAPGFHRDDFKIEIEKRVITISAQKEKDHLGSVDHRCEYDYSGWTRAFTLPSDADALLVFGEYQNGELLLRIPRSSSSEIHSKTTICVY